MHQKAYEHMELNNYLSKLKKWRDNT